ncbi:hypothetical protein EXIGLDRAFT_128312 [Exidia glandulosa HHB12029]|uniref:WW domain-containing protein n=1 Tax=Exidia glandulosa HHB12029 TaxID=1314781 RepID=A0A166AAH5_EXIGL|nr:hypothetical protein EXIGLDRAFT_128312 [Exidia glandulosa HHB12029]
MGVPDFASWRLTSPLPPMASYVGAPSYAASLARTSTEEKSVVSSTGAQADARDLPVLDAADRGDHVEVPIHDLHMPYEHWMPWTAERPGHNAYPSTKSSVRERPDSIADAGIPEGWMMHIHPNGSIYYEKKDDKITSNFDLRRTAQEHDYFVKKLKTSRAYDYRQDHWWVNLTRRDGETGFIWIDHTTMSASTLNQDPSDFKRDMDRDDIVSRLERHGRYWTYVQGHPNHFGDLPNSAYREAYDALSWCYADRLLFKHTNATFSKEDSKDLLEMLDRMQKERGPSPLRNWFVASTLRAIVSDRQGTHYGQHDAPKYRQREADDMIGTFEDLAWPMKLLYYGLGIVLFLGIPHTYFRRIQDVDRTRFNDGVNAMRWKAFLRSLLKEWSDSNLLATVLISYAMHTLR